MLTVTTNTILVTNPLALFRAFGTAFTNSGEVNAPSRLFALSITTNPSFNGNVSVEQACQIDPIRQFYSKHLAQSVQETFTLEESGGGWTLTGRGLHFSVTLAFTGQELSLAIGQEKNHASRFRLERASRALGGGNIREEVWTSVTSEDAVFTNDMTYDQILAFIH